MDVKIILCILAGMLVLTVCGFYVLYRRLNRLETASVQLQRFLLMSRSTTPTGPNTMPNAVPNPVSNAVPNPVSNAVPNVGPRSGDSKNQPNRGRSAPPIPNLNNVLPMMNTFMTMFQGGEGPEPDEINDKAKEMVKEENKRRGLEKEIEKELGELASSEIKEGRVEEVVEEIETVKEIEKETAPIETDKVEVEVS